MGRKTKLTPAIQAKMLQMIRQGIAGERAAEACGLNASTFYVWLNRGEAAKSGMFHEFFKAVKKADAEAEVLIIGRIQLAAQSGTWTAAAWIAERKWRERWGRHLKMDIDYSGLSDEQLERLAEGEHPATALADTGER